MTTTTATTKTPHTFEPGYDLREMALGDSVRTDDGRLLELIQAEEGVPLFSGGQPGLLAWAWTCTMLGMGWKFYAVGHWPAKVDAEVLAELQGRAAVIHQEAELAELEAQEQAYHEEMERQYQMRARRK